MKKYTLLAAAALLGSGLCLALDNAEMERNVLNPFAVWKTTRPAANLPGKNKPEDVVRKRNAHIAALKMFAPYKIFQLARLSFLTVPVAELRKNKEACGWDLVSAMRSLPPASQGCFPCVWIRIRKTS